MWKGTYSSSSDVDSSLAGIIFSMPSLRQNLVVQFPSLQPMFSGGMLRKDDHERIAFVGHQYTAWAIVFPLFFSDLSSALVHKAAWEWLGNSVIVFCARRRSSCWKGDRKILKDSSKPNRFLWTSCNSCWWTWTAAPSFGAFRRWTQGLCSAHSPRMFDTVKHAQISIYTLQKQWSY